jgi:hypothetical protein
LTLLLVMVAVCAAAKNTPQLAAGIFICYRKLYTRMNVPLSDRIVACDHHFWWEVN